MSALKRLVIDGTFVTNAVANTFTAHGNIIAAPGANRRIRILFYNIELVGSAVGALLLRFTHTIDGAARVIRLSATVPAAQRVANHLVFDEYGICCDVNTASSLTSICSVAGQTFFYTVGYIDEPMSIIY